MNSAKALLAAIGPPPQWFYFLVIFAVIVLSAFGVFIWAVAFRKKRKRKYRSRHHRHEPRKVNPTLAEKGGLPPAREETDTGPPTPPP